MKSNRRILPYTGFIKVRDVYDCEVEYIRIEDGSKAWVDLGIAGDVTIDAIEVEFQLVVANVQTRIAVGNNIIMYVNGSSKFAVGLYDTRQTWQQVYAENVGTVKRKWKVDYGAKKSSVDDYKNYTWTKILTPSSSGSVKVAYWNEGSSTTGKFNGKLYSVKYWRNTRLIRDMIPVRVGSVGYMFDKVEGKLYSSAGIESFKYGRDVYKDISYYTTIDYVEHAKNSSTIDTRYIPNQDTRVVWDSWQCLVASTWQEPLTARTGYQQNDFTFDTICGDASGKPRDVYANHNYTPSVNIHRHFKIDKNKNVSTIYDAENNTSLWTSSHTYRTFNSQRYLWLGCKNKGNLTSYSGNYTGATFGLQAYSNGVLERNYIPVIHPDGTCGLFDSVYGKFYESETNPFIAGNFYYYNDNNDRCIFFHIDITDELTVSTSYANLATSIIPVSSQTILIKRDSVYTTTIVELNNKTIIKKGGQTIISEDNSWEEIELDANCNSIIVLLSDKPEIGYVPDFKILMN